MRMRPHTHADACAHSIAIAHLQVLHLQLHVSMHMHTGWASMDSGSKPARQANHFYHLIICVGVCRDRPDMDPVTELEAQPEDIAEAALMPFKCSRNALPVEIMIQTLKNYKK